MRSSISLPKEHSILRQRVPLLAPFPKAAVHRNDVGVAHLLQIVCCERRAKTAAAIKHQLCIEVWEASFNITLDDAFAHVNSPRQVVFGEFALLAHVDESELVSAVHPGFYRIDTIFMNTGFRVVHNFQKTGSMLVGHEAPLK